MKDYYRSAFVFKKATYFTRKNDYFKTTNESEPMGLGRRTSTSGYRDEYDFMFIT